MCLLQPPLTKQRSAFIQWSIIFLSITEWLFFILTDAWWGEREGGQRICRDKSGWSARGEKDKMRQRKSSGGVREREDENRALKTTGLTRMKNEFD